MDLGWRLARRVVGVGGSTLPLRLRGICVVVMVDMEAMIVNAAAPDDACSDDPNPFCILVNH